MASVFDAKRLIGRKFADAEVQADIKHFPFKVIDKAGKPYVRVQYRGEDKEFVSCRLIPSNVNCAHTVCSRPRRSRLWFS